MEVTILHLICHAHGFEVLEPEQERYGAHLYQHERPNEDNYMLKERLCEACPYPLDGNLRETST